MEIIIRGRHDHFGKVRSEQEENMRKEWGATITDEQLDKLKYAEKLARESPVPRKISFQHRTLTISNDYFL